MELARAADGDFQRGNVSRFTGEVWIRWALEDRAGTGVGIVSFAPGARTHWHRHPGGQFLVVTSGRGRVRSRGEPGAVLHEGDAIRVGQEWHCHGGDRDAPLVHVAINVGGPPEWGDPVTDEEYDEGF
jgi:quercetin dioxygenase-like cupin family protein